MCVAGIEDSDKIKGCSLLYTNLDQFNLGPRLLIIKPHTID